ncbi:hypothetical protein [Acinetobacter bereziniae]|uniref:Uncharacterized protein n=1 Tax=Acinetobacter bereziniae NIPH 3 TaxID=1217651 RepID=N8YPF2_ACIBZ|nr:hypothetical protein [Acinetobacter bereziniae]ENV21100.1 hypothetical protein F963_02865 [Acinetobacter bereziniae NIPH 3]
MANKVMSLQAWLTKEEGLKKQFLEQELALGNLIKKYELNERNLNFLISDTLHLKSHFDHQASIKNFLAWNYVPVRLSDEVFNKLKIKFRIFKFNLKNKNENRVKKQLFIDQKTMSRLEQIIKDNELNTIQNGLNFLMDGLSLKMRETKELNHQNTIKIQFQNEQLDLLKQQNNQYKKRNKALVIQYNKKLENLTSSLSDYATKDFQQRLNQSLENILDQQVYTEVFESRVISSLLDKLSEEIKTRIEEATSMIEVQDLNPES